MRKKNIIAPFWSWNDKLEPLRLTEQMEVMKSAGIDGFFMHARGGLTTEYMGEEWFECIKACMDKSEELGMEAWAYDENGWPSGFANGAVPKKSVDFQQKRLAVVFPKDGDAMPENILGIYRISDSKCQLISEREHGCAVIYYTVNPYYIDTFNPKAIACFISETHEKYFERFGEHFGKSLKGFFTDEPQYSGVPWSHIFTDLFYKKYGYSLIEKLPLIYFELDGFEAFRTDFYNMAAEQFRAAFMKQIYDWCSEHGCALTGHMLNEDSLKLQIDSTGGVMACYEYFHQPGVDWLGRRIASPFMPKQLGSAARQLGRKTLSESFALSGWDVSPNELKWIAQWQMVNGVTSFCPHLEGYTLRGERKRDYPASLFYQLPWFDSAYKPFAEEICKIGTILDEGTEVAPVLLIEPMQTAYIRYNPGDFKGISSYQSEFEDLTCRLSDNHILYHYGDESLMKNHGRVDGNKLIIGCCEYTTVILPDMLTLKDNTLRLLCEFAENGGELLYTGEMPVLVNGRENAAVGSLKAKKLSVENLKAEYGFASIRTNGSENGNIHYTKRIMPNGDRIYYLVNLSNEKQSVCFDFGEKALTECRLRCDECITVGNTLEFGPYGSFVLAAGESFTPSAVEKREKEYVRLCERFEVSPDTVNCFTLDTCRYRIDGGEWQPRCAVILLQKQLLELQRPCKIELAFDFFAEEGALCDNLRLCAESPEKFDFSINGKSLEFVPEGSFIDSAIKTCGISSYVKTGENTIVMSGDFYQSDNVYRVLFTPGIHETEINKLTYDTELESIYLTGSFGVRADSPVTYGERKSVFAGRDFTLTAMPKEVDISNVTESGFWFFAGKMELFGKINIPIKKSTEYVLAVERLYCPAAELIINGKAAGLLSLAPFELNITDFLKDGENEITVRLLSGNRNLLGPHHRPRGEVYNVCPDTFTNRLSWADEPNEPLWTDDYSFVKFGISRV